MTTLITGGGSSVGAHLGLLLKAAGREAIFASRSGNRIPDGFSNVKLDWKDPSTFESALNASPNIEYVYIVGEPLNPEHVKDIVPFIELAVKKGGIKKFVYISATVYSEYLGNGQVPKYLKENHIDHVILRPTWFIDNLKMVLGSGTQKRDQFETAIPTGRIPFVAAEDIAWAGVKAITEDIVNKDIIVIGPELLTYTELAKATGEVLGRTITHKPVSPEELVKIRGPWMKLLIDQEVDIENNGIEEAWWNMPEEEAKKLGVEVFKGKTTAREWVEKNKAAFD
ncbi:NmrA family protein [Coprinopsis sp. MPI-PUGE-AT-0042]|nr:NmrA family protein [Coprinopsis sp. MPI-PUGE-AT-0042]